MSRVKFVCITPEIYAQNGFKKYKNMFCSSRPGIFQTNCKLFLCGKEKQETKERFHPVDPRTLQNKAARNNLLNSRILERVNCINWEFKVSVKSTMSSVIYFTFYRNDKFFYKSLNKTHKF